MLRIQMSVCCSGSEAAWWIWGSAAKRIKSKKRPEGRAGQLESQGGGKMGLTHQKGTHWRPDEGKSFPARFSET